MGPTPVLAPPPWGVIPPPAALAPPPRSRIGLSQTLQSGQAALTTAPPRIPTHPLWLWPRPRGALLAPSGTLPPISQWQSRGRARGDQSRRRRAGRGAIRGGLWLGLAWLLLARAPGAAGTPNSPRRPRSYTHLESDVRWRRLFSSTHFFLCVEPSGHVQGTLWRDSPDSVFFEMRSIRVGVVALKAVNTGFYVAMNRRGRHSRSVSASAQGGLGCVGRARWGRVQRRAQGRSQPAPKRVCATFRECIEENGYNTYESVPWRHHGRPMFLALDGRGAPRRGVRTQRHHPSTHFLPVLVS
ncbi:fibroblast growth factor 22 [Mesoplodon densirostris]|uniref:fibroblast growth factor 22 n=1 Tax=Mesoplodon densirostris TaxID=48708 RepID=UPI0028DC4311|nr:fibroblast growth factor 22 [Mesoplodon densirostris]